MGKTQKVLRWLGILLIVPLIIAQGVQVLAAPSIPRQTDEFYVNDFAGVLSQETKDYVIQRSKALAEETKAQVAVAVVDSLEGETIEDYANAMFRQYGIGDEKENNGVLILLAIKDREVRIEVGYGLEGAINDAKAGRIIRSQGTPFLKDNDWDTGIKLMYTGVMEAVYEEYGLQPPSELDTSSLLSEEDTQSGEEDSGHGDLIWIILVIIVLIIMNSNNRRGGRRGGGFRGPYIGGGFGGGFGGGGFGGGGFGGGGSLGGGGSSGGGGASGRF